MESIWHNALGEEVVQNVPLLDFAFWRLRYWINYGWTDILGNFVKRKLWLTILSLILFLRLFWFLNVVKLILMISQNLWLLYLKLMCPKEICQFWTQILTFSITILQRLIPYLVKRQVVMDKIVPNLGSSHVNLFFELGSHDGSWRRLIFRELWLHLNIEIILKEFLFLLKELLFLDYLLGALLYHLLKCLFVILLFRLLIHFLIFEFG